MTCLPATSIENGRCVIGTSKASSGSVPMPPARRSAAGFPCASPSPSASNGNSRLDFVADMYTETEFLDEFDPLIHEPGVNVVPIRSREPLGFYAAVILPGSKNTAESVRALHALRGQTLAQAH